MQPHHTGLKVRCRSAVASAPGKWCSRQDSHLHWRRSQRRVSSVGLREQRQGGLPPVLPRRDFPTKEACGCRKEAKWSQSPVLPWTQRAYETCLSAGSTAMLSNNQQNGAPTRSCTRLACLPSRCIADNALGASEMVGARRLARPRLPDSESGGSAIPRKPRADEDGVPDRLRSGDLLHERQACWLDYTTGTKMVRAKGFAPLT